MWSGTIKGSKDDLEFIGVVSSCIFWILSPRFFMSGNLIDNESSEKVDTSVRKQTRLGIQ